ncbi:MAG: thiolase [Deltaproteobacteria bacterium]|jgi:acetyl-CoA acetyltransferase|nr:thiolase [Deltaproteobacteria bacterium]
MRDRICIVGVAESDCGSVPDQSALQLHHQAAKAACEDAGLEKRAIDGLFSCGSDGMHPLQVAEYLGLRPTYIDGTQVGGSSWEFFVEHATAALQAGLCTVALLVYGSTARSDWQRRLRVAETPPARGPAQFEAPYGLTLVGKYALAARRHMHEYGTTHRQLAAVAVSANRWAQLNPRAFNYGKPLSIDEALKSRMIADPLHQSDCGLRTDGGGAVILATAERARDLRRKPIRVLGTGEAVSHVHLSQWHEMPSLVAAESGSRALEQAGLTVRDVDVLQIYDALTIMVLLTLEALGFCEPGESGPLAESGALAPGGRLPTNTDGGGLAANHPGMRGLFLLIEATRQLRGECGARQVPNARVALCNGTGGYLSSCGTVVLGE